MQPKKNILFLFNHDAAHQVAHSVGITAALADNYRNDANTIIAYGSNAIRAEIEKHLSAPQINALTWLDLSLPAWANLVVTPFNRLFPARRLARLIAGASRLRQCDMIVSTERTCLMLKRRWKGLNCPQFTYIPHGSGDRNVAVHPALKDFDLCMVSGQKVVGQLVTAGVATPEKCRVIGYTKFDILRGRKPEKFFDNDKPVFLYNPHFDPHLSSWYDHGPALLQYFAAHPEYNLIFAPHVMLFFKKLHVSAEYKISRTRPEIPSEILDAPNIRIDTDSPRLFDMSYTLSADAYIGDISSQIYEFLYQPRPVFIIDTHSQESGSDELAYEFWKNGPVVRDLNSLFEVLPRWREIGVQYQPEQVRLMNQTADRSDPRPASARGAEALINWLIAPLP
jgi:hypothetical protein